MTMQKCLLTLYECESKASGKGIQLRLYRYNKIQHCFNSSAKQLFTFAMYFPPQNFPLCVSFPPVQTATESECK